MKAVTKAPRSFVIGFAILIVLASLAFLAWTSNSRRPATVPEPGYWPTQGWLASTPEEQGLDSARLAEGLRAIQKSGLPIHSLMIVRNDKVLLEAAFYPYDGTSPHSVGSVTKSLTTLLIGIAIDHGDLRLDDTLISFFPDRTIANLDARKRNITIRDLASMSSGLDCVYEPNEPTVYAMETSPDWVQFGLDLPMAFDPGTHWEYCGVGMHLLSAVLERATGMSALEFARRNLFEPLGIRDVVWPTDPQGVNLGAGNTRLLPRDMAKIGFLVLHGGVWDGRQIVSQAWVDASVSKLFVRPNGDRYGYGWWSGEGDAGMSFFAQGNGGQVINISPGFNSVVVTTGGGFTYDDVVPYILAAFLDPKKPLPANPAAVAELEQVLAVLPRSPSPQPVLELPDLARDISGKTLRFDQNPFGLERATLDFADPSVARFQAAFSDGSRSPMAEVGLDGVYRLTPGMNLDRLFHRFVDYENLSVGMRGRWVDPGTFLLEYDTILNYYYYSLQIHIEDGKMSVTASDHAGNPLAAFSGRVEGP